MRNTNIEVKNDIRNICTSLFPGSFRFDSVYHNSNCSLATNIVIKKPHCYSIKLHAWVKTCATSPTAGNISKIMRENSEMRF